MTLTRQEFRRDIRQKRNLLSSDDQYQAGQDLIRQFLSLDEYPKSQHIALYLSTDGEIDTMPLIEALWQRRKQIYLPVLHPFSSGQLLFLNFAPSTPMVYNKYGIIEPKLDKRLVKPVEQLDLIATPLVGFDAQGHRLGMGGGYYDRTLARWHNDAQGPRAIGLAHDCQYVDQLPTESWDVPLTKIVTPSQIWQWEC
ncbi:5-formyltetrahydrofolate cyclo-ligase [Vibrio sp.]|uniref:5-formyltetrahydrofolate cyclo-ligase n=1 Tax=Vibrio sp. TaxID=678 RepID=UPI003D0C5C41